MKAILINPQDKTVTEVEHNGDFKEIYQLIDAACFDCVRIDAKETIYVDDEGLLNCKQETVGMFRVAGDNPAYLVGKALILSTDDEGESAATELTVEQVRAMVDFGFMMRSGSLLAFVGAKSIYTINRR